ncbi:GGDEF domain-containing protein [Amycolatopsis sp. CA-230715]|uniref:GGDEF domain-containing protein n=1 Tax=Amycolatopsis sp. CA-230715 TaxID=2745196 RepID=UPI001C029EC3|nr:sensor domain-containing diguanylate cyclase [Amycolatopsis sp. CA-230715]QWF78386.1 hypothetical protein HUW46_01782 [Amycolatopsis sp. CA-230715]
MDAQSRPIALSFRDAHGLLRALLVALPASSLMLLVLGFLARHPTAAEWARFGGLAGFAVLQGELSRQVERARRRYGSYGVVSMTSVWIMAAAITLPLPLCLALVPIIYGHLYFRAWRGTSDYMLPNRVVYNIGMHAWTLAVSHVVLAGFTLAAPSTVGVTPHTAVLAAVAVLAYFGVNGVLVAIGLHLRGQQTLTGYFLRLHEATLELSMLALGVVVGLIVVSAPALIPFVLLPVVVMHRAALTRQLQKAAETDAKTGLANAASWQAQADDALRAAARDHAQAGVLMLDLDFFKKVNDTYGHYAGDDVLAAVGEMLRTDLRRFDVPGRFGGEEFAVLLPGTDHAGTMRIAERLRQRVTELEVRTEDGNGTPVTVTGLSASIGAALYPDHGTEVRACLRAADQFVYRAKRTGRNRVVGEDRPAVPTPRLATVTPVMTCS